MQKRLFLCCLLLLSVITGRCAEPWFNTSVGTILSYTRHNVEDGSVKWNHEMIILSVAETASVTTVGYSSMITMDNGRALTKKPVIMKTRILLDGTVEMDLAGTMTAVLSGFFPNAKVTSTGGTAALPGDMKPGDVLADAKGGGKVRGINYTVSVTDRKVLRNESLTTPAGTFDCVVVSEHKEEKAIGYSRVTTALTWYCREYGMIRHDTYDRNMKLETSEVLESIEKI